MSEALREGCGQGVLRNMMLGYAATMLQTYPEHVPTGAHIQGGASNPSEVPQTAHGAYTLIHRATNLHCGDIFFFN